MVREAYNVSKSIALKRDVNKKQSPACSIDKEEIHKFFQNIWATPTRDFSIATPDSPFYLEPKIPQEATESMEEFMLNDKSLHLFDG
jgi:hypothetical protein